MNDNNNKSENEIYFREELKKLDKEINENLKKNNDPSVRYLSKTDLEKRIRFSKELEDKKKIILFTLLEEVDYDLNLIPKIKTIDINKNKSRLKYYKSIENHVFQKNEVLDGGNKYPMVFFNDGNLRVVKKANSSNTILLKLYGNVTNEELESFFEMCQEKNKIVHFSAINKTYQKALKVANKYNVSVVNLVPKGIDYLTEFEKKDNVFNASLFLNDKEVSEKTIKLTNNLIDSLSIQEHTIDKTQSKQIEKKDEKENVEWNFKKELDDLTKKISRQKYREQLEPEIEISSIKKVNTYEEPDEETMKKVEDSTEYYENLERINSEKIQKSFFLVFVMNLLESKNYDFEKINKYLLDPPTEEEQIQQNHINEERVEDYLSTKNLILEESIPSELRSENYLKTPPILFHKGDVGLLNKNKEIKLLTLSFDEEDEKTAKKLKDDLEEFFINCKLIETTVIIAANEKYSELALKLATKYSISIINILPYGVDHIRDCENEFNILNISPFLNDKKIDFTTLEVVREYKDGIKNNFKEQIFEKTNQKQKKKVKKGVSR